MWLGSEMMLPSPRPRRTGRATRIAHSSGSSVDHCRALIAHHRVFQSYVCPRGHLTFPLDKRSSPRLDDQPPGHVSPLSGWVLPYPAGYGFPRPFGCRRSLLAPSCARCGVGPLLRWGYWRLPDHNGVTTFRIGKRRRASWPLYAGSRAPSQPSR